MIRKPNFKLNWRYALGELTLIFLGISLAIWFNNWNDKRKRSKLEEEVLLQIYIEILTNRDEIQGDLQQLSFGLQSHENIERYIAQDLAYVDSMCFDFHWLKHDEYAFPATGGYENLKSLGLDLIKNDTIRQNIQLTYEFGYPRVSRETPFHPNIDEFFTPYYLKHFTTNEDTTLVFSRPWVGGTVGYPFWSEVGGVKHDMHIGYVPLGYEALKKDPEFKVLMRQAKIYRTYKMRQYQRMLKVTDELSALIERQLKFEPDPLEDPSTP